MKQLNITLNVNEVVEEWARLHPEWISDVIWLDAAPDDKEQSEVL